MARQSIPKQGQVVLTGASSFLGAHILDQLLKNGYHVRGTARSQKKADRIFARYCNDSRLELVVVDDVSVEGSLDEVVSGALGVIHVASPVNLHPEDNITDLLHPAVNGTLNVLSAAARTSTVRRVVLTATMATMSHIGSGPIPGKVYTEADWNPVTWDNAVASQDGHYVYCASKTFAEQAAWQYMKENKPKFDLVATNPAWLVGPFLQSVDRSSDLSESLRECYTTIMGGLKEVPPTKVQYWIDVRDAAKAHVMALEMPEAEGRYLVANPEKFDWKKAFNALRKRFPDRRFPQADDDYYVQSRPEVNVAKAEYQFGFGWTSLEDSFADMTTQFYEIKEKGFL